MRPSASASGTICGGGLIKLLPKLLNNFLLPNKFITIFGCDKLSISKNNVEHKLLRRRTPNVS